MDCSFSFSFGQHEQTLNRPLSGLYGKGDGIRTSPVRLISVMRRKGLVALLAIPLLAAAWWSFGQELYIVPSEPVQVVGDLEDRSAVVVATLAPGEVVPVTACLNQKQDQVYRVRVSNGTEGYVASGKYEIRREPWKLMGKRVVCH